MFPNSKCKCKRTKTTHAITGSVTKNNSTDKTNSMVGKKNSLLTKIKNAQQCGQTVFDIGCPCHLAYLFAEKWAKELSQH